MMSLSRFGKAIQESKMSQLAMKSKSKEIGAPLLHRDDPAERA